MIKRIRIKNFRRIADAELHPHGVNVVAGPNGAGKSSIAAAIEFGLTRRNEWCDGRGTGLLSQVAHGARSASVEISAGGIEQMSTIPLAKNLGKSSATIYEALGLRHDADTSEQVARAHLRCGNFLAMRPADQQMMLCKVMRLELDAARLPELLNSLDSRFPDLAEWLDGNIDAGTPVTSTALGEACREHRRAAKALLANSASRRAVLRARLDSMPQLVPDVAAARARHAQAVTDLAELDAEEGPLYDVYRAQTAVWEMQCQVRNAAHKESARAYAAWIDAQSHIVDAPLADATAEQIDAQIAALTEERGRYAASPTPSSEWQRAIARIDGALCDAAIRVMDARAHVQSLRATRPDDWQRECVSGECRVRTLRAIDASIATAIEEVEAEERRTSDLHVQRSALEREARERLLSIDEQLKCLRDDRQRVDDHASAIEKAEQARRSLEVSRAHLNEIAPDRPAPIPPAADDARRDTLTAAVVDAERAMEVAEAIAMECSRRDELQGEVDAEDAHCLDLADAVARWELLVAAFDARSDVSLPRRLLRTGIADFERDVNADCQEWFGFGVRIRMDDGDWSVSIVHRDGEVLASQASGAERVLLSAAVQASLARRSGFSLMMLDEVGVMDGAHLVMLGSYVERVAVESQVQIWLFMAACEESDRYTIMGAFGWDARMYWVSDGVITCWQAGEKGTQTEAIATR